jgi:hypothetical protein
LGSKITWRKSLLPAGENPYTETFALTSESTGFSQEGVNKHRIGEEPGAKAAALSSPGLAWVFLHLSLSVTGLRRDVTSVALAFASMKWH